jgi:MazG family protein
MAREQGAFGLSEVVASVCDKMTRRHPHVFGDVRIEDANAQTEAWESAKTRERRARGLESLLDDVPKGMAELQRSVKLQKRAAKVGFDWPEAEQVFDKLEEETAEIRAAMASGDADAVEDEIGDLLFAATNLARKLGTDPARALRRANAKFESRFRAVEMAAGGVEGLEQMTLDEMEALWQSAKRDSSA